MTKLIPIFFLLVVVAGAQEPVEPKPIIWDKFEVSTNTAGLTIGGKVIDKAGVITTVSVAKDHSVTLAGGKLTVIGGTVDIGAYEYGSEQYAITTSTNITINGTGMGRIMGVVQ
jgi:hypothetical protein